MPEPTKHQRTSSPKGDPKTHVYIYWGSLVLPNLWGTLTTYPSMVQKWECETIVVAFTDHISSFTLICSWFTSCLNLHCWIQTTTLQRSITYQKALPAIKQFTYRTIGGVIDLYFFLGPSPENMVQQYTEVRERGVCVYVWMLYHTSRVGESAPLILDVWFLMRGCVSIVINP